MRLARALRELLKAHLRRARAAHYVRRAVRRNRSGLRIIIGASGTAYAGWIPTEYPLIDVGDAVSLRRFFKDGSVDAILAEHVWEHLSLGQAAAAAENCFRLLKGGGYLRIAVPDGLHPDKEYIDYVRPGGHGAGSDDHKVLYTYRTLTNLLGAAGFRVTLLEWFDEDERFHFREWDPAMGYIARSTRFDDRNKTNPTAYTSLIADAVKD